MQLTYRDWAGRRPGSNESDLSLPFPSDLLLGLALAKFRRKLEGMGACAYSPLGSASQGGEPVGGRVERIWRDNWQRHSTEPATVGPL